MIPSACFLASQAFPANEQFPNGVLGMGWGHTNFPDTCPLYYLAHAGFATDGVFIVPEVQERGRITTAVNLVGLDPWNSIIFRTETNVTIPGSTYRWEIVIDGTHYFDRGNLSQGDASPGNVIESEASWVEFTADSLSTSLNDAKVMVSYISPGGCVVWRDYVTFTTADIRYLAYTDDAAHPEEGWRVRSLIPVDVFEVGGSSSQDEHFMRLMVGLSSSIGLSTVRLKLASIDENGRHLPSDFYFNEIPELETVEGVPEEPLSGVTYFTSIKEIGAITVLFTEQPDVPSALWNTLENPSAPRRYVVCLYGGTLRPFLVLQSP